MILPLRNRHRRIVIVLAIMIPIVFAWGILGRRPIPLTHGGEGSTSVQTEKSP